MKTDNELKQDLLSQFKNVIELGPGVNSDDIEVSVINGIVSLKGSVPSYADKVAILKAVKGEKGILAWADDIVVKIPDEYHRADAELAAAARDAIDTITTVPADSINITVQDGCLTLAGTVEHMYQREAVEYAVNSLCGLIGVLNLISLSANNN